MWLWIGSIGSLEQYQPQRFVCNSLRLNRLCQKKHTYLISKEELVPYTVYIYKSIFELLIDLTTVDAPTFLQSNPTLQQN